jgi:RNA polymerase sigma factor (sigma-70 family)
VDARRERFARLIEPLHDRVVGFARCLCRSTADGDDLFQEAMVRAFAKLDGLRDDAAFRRWLYRIVVSVHRTRSRRAFWRRLLPLAEVTEDTGVDYRSESNPGDVAASRRARTALARLPAVQREAIVLFEIEDWQIDEIAALQRVSTSAVKSRLARGRARLRALYDEAPAPAVPAAAGETP